MYHRQGVIAKAQARVGADAAGANELMGPAA
jgi:hypothetical protein